MEKISFAKVCGPERSALDVVFVHGLTGDPLTTWNGSGKEPEGFWPAWLCSDFGTIATYTLGYPAPIFGKWASQQLNLFECAKVALEHLSAHGIGSRPVAFIAHSLGGILTKQILRTANDAADSGWNAIASNTRDVFFLATPHTGATLAAVIHYITPQFSSANITALSNKNGHLNDLNEAYKNLAKERAYNTHAYYELHGTKGLACIVTKESADPGVSGTTPIPVEQDHIGICKPKNRDSVIHRSVQRHLQTTMQTCADHDVTFGTDYSAGSATDRRDLQQKLIDGKREHLYKTANEQQNKFAQGYHRLGLHTTARARCDTLLSEVEQRFAFHVYDEKIQKGASHDEVNQALQVAVIDPICAKFGKEFPAPVVLRAVYYLTEQCHLRWDPQ